MSPHIASISAALLFVTVTHADEPQELVQLRHRFDAIKHPAESDRVRYITSLVRLRESLTRADYKKMDAIDAEVIKHAMPSDVDSTELRKRLVGQWRSPRHSYLYRANGTWTMLDTQQSMHGVWRIEGNRCFQRATVESPESDTGEMMIILTDTDFVWSTHVAPYYMRRGYVYPWRLTNSPDEPLTD